MNIDELKKSWHDMKEELDRVEALNRDLTEQLHKSKALPFKNRIMNQYRVLVIVSAMMVAVMFMMYIDNTIFSRGLSGSMVFYFIAMMVMNLTFMLRLRRIDVNTMSVAEMIEQTIKLRILRSRLKLIGYILMVPMLFVLLWTMYQNDMGMFVGGVCGGMVGLVIGLRIDRAIDRDIRKMKAALKEEFSEGD